jgi:general secretion pathway protein M
MKNSKVRENIVLAATVLVLMLPVVLLGSYAANKYQWAKEQLSSLEPRYARLLGLESQQKELNDAAAQAKLLRGKFLYPAEQDATQAGNAAQQRVREIFSNAGLQVNSSQVLASKKEKGFERVPLTVRTEGDLLSLQTALAALAGQSPVIVIDDFDVQVVGGLSATNPPRLATSFGLSVLRAQP